MKHLLHYIGLTAIGLTTAILLYPLLHELGHVVASLVLGAEISNLKLFPLPSVMCKLNTSNVLYVVFVCFNGMLLPYMVSIIPPEKHFWNWYIWFVISGICLLSFVISIISIVSYRIGRPMANEDITQALIYAPQYHVLYIVVLVVLSLLRIVQIVHTHPIQRCLKHFEIL